MATLCVILGDQLHPDISSLRAINRATDWVLMAEVKDEATYVRHHKKKIALVFSAMRHFAHQLRREGYRVLYTEFDDNQNQHSLTGEVERAVSSHDIDAIVVTECGEFRLQQQINTWSSVADLNVVPNDHFMCTPFAFAEWAKDRKQLRMELFYREMRKSYNILMDNGQPVGGQWNFDKDNRKKAPKNLQVPQRTEFLADDVTQRVLTLVAEYFDDHFGDLLPFAFAVTREQALEVLGAFVTQRLPNFGDFQDAMVQGEPWMYHAHISFYLNLGMLTPAECISAAEQAYSAGTAPLNAVEGFIRQILGWREYVRGLYWLKMPDYKRENALNAQRPLPTFFWNAETKMNCLRQCISETKANAYAHHIQRLMVLGNFALLAGLHPDEVNEWYLIVYADAFEWVELPNVTGMILFADDGILASKPYAASGAYIDKMSNYCKSCAYQVKEKNGPDACPFNYLYWDFLIRHTDKFKGNPRMGMIYRTLETMSEEKHRAITEDSQVFFEALYGPQEN